MKIEIIAKEASSADVNKALLDLAKWFNTTRGLSPIRLNKCLNTIREVYGYTRYNGDCYRAFPVTRLPKAGSTPTLTTGTRPIQSWSASLRGALRYRGHMGNTDNIVIVKLLSKTEEQLCSNRWLYPLAKRLLKDKEIATGAKELISTIRRPGSPEDEDEVILRIPSKVRVEVVRVYPKWDG